MLHHRGLEKTCACGSAFSCELGPLAHPHTHRKPALREDLQEALFPQAWKWIWQDAVKVSLLQGRNSRQPASVCKPVFGRNRFGLPAENYSSAQRPEMQESEPNSSPALGQPCKDILASIGTALMKLAAGIVRHYWAPSWGQLRYCVSTQSRP